MVDPSTEQEFYNEAQRLGQLPRADQQAVISMYRRLADNPISTTACRVHAKAKAKALVTLLGVRPAKKPSKAHGKAKAGNLSAKQPRKR
jgi:hypothetical protein